MSPPRRLPSPHGFSPRNVEPVGEVVEVVRNRHDSEMSVRQEEPPPSPPPLRADME